MKFCPFCGYKVNEDSKFCSGCGVALAQNNEIKKDYSVSITGERICPSCGAAVNSFSVACPSCGREVDFRQTSGACRELCEKLEALERNKPEVSKAATVSAMVSAVKCGLFGTSYHDPTEREQKKIDAEVNKKKYELISNFVIPNNKADIMEFLFMAESNCQAYKYGKSYDGIVGEYDADAFVKLWQSKFDETYSKALIVMGNDSDFLKFKHKKETEEEAERIKRESTISAKLKRKLKESIDNKLS